VDCQSTYQSGNTIRFEADFQNLSGEFYDPSRITFFLYDYRYNILSSQVLSGGNRIGQGKYYYEMSLDIGDYIYEWNAEKDGKISLVRKPLTTRFV